jgi:integrase
VSKRRKSGTGSITWRARERRAQVRIKIDGEPYETYIPAETEEEGRRLAEIQLDKWRQQHEREGGVPTVTTLGALLDLWLGSNPNWSPSTLREYRKYAQMAREHFGERLALENLTPRRLQAYLEKQNGICNRNKAKNILWRAWRFGTTHPSVALPAEDPFERLFVPRYRAPEVKVWNEEQVRAFRRACETDFYGVVFLTALETGLRYAELMGLRWEDLDLGRGLLRVERKRVRAEKAWHEGRPKTTSGRRTLPLAGLTRQRLQFVHEVQKDWAANAGAAWKGEGRIFTTRNGRPIENSNLNKAIKRICRKAKLPEAGAAHLHLLRHTLASHTLDENIPVSQVAAYLGHAGPHITMRLYAHLVGDTRDVADGIQRRWGA